MKVLKQNSGDNNCVAVVAAMAFDKEVKDFLDSAKHGQPFGDFDFCKYAFDNDAICCLGVGEEMFCDKIDVTDSNSKEPEFLLNQKELNGEYKVRIEFQLKDYPAYVVVQSLDGESEHALLWSGDKVYDPNPLIENGRSINKYKILRWYPIIKMEGIK